MTIGSNTLGVSFSRTVNEGLVSGEANVTSIGSVTHLRAETVVVINKHTQMTHVIIQSFATSSTYIRRDSAFLKATHAGEYGSRGVVGTYSRHLCHGYVRSQIGSCHKNDVTTGVDKTLIILKRLFYRNRNNIYLSIFLYC